MKLRLCYFGHPVLREKAKPIQEITSDIRQFAADMIETMFASNGVGLAAPQVGRSIRMYIYASLEKNEHGESIVVDPQVVINPVISQFSQEQELFREGCLSIPDVLLDIERSIKIHIRYQTLDGSWVEKDMEGFEARVNLHEYDHLNGVLHIDHVSSEERKRIEPRLQVIQSKYHNIQTNS